MAQPVRQVLGRAEVVGTDAQAVLERYDAAFVVGDTYSPILVKDKVVVLSGVGPGLMATHSELRSCVAGLTQNEDAVNIYRRAGWAEIGTVPVYMRPRTYHYRDSIPLAANGKIDRKALPR